MKTITLSAPEHLIQLARDRARAENTTLDAAFRQWLEAYTSQAQRAAQFDQVVDEVCGQLKVGKKLSRDEMNAR